MSKGWEQTTLGEVVSFKGGGTPSTEKRSYWNGDIPWVSPKDMKSAEVGDSIDKITMEAIENSAASLIPKNAILVVVRSGILARTIPVAITTRSLAVNQDIKALCPKKDIDPCYLHYFMQMAEPNILKLVTRGATVHRLSTGSLKALRFVKPPLLEQQRIVAVLDEVFAGLASVTANADKNLQNARELFESHLSRRFDQASEHHESRRLADIVSRLTNGYVGPTRNIYLQNGVPYLLARHVHDNRLEFDGKTFVSDQFNEKNKKSKLRTGDVLLVQSGHIGHSAVVGPDHDGHNCHAMIVITPVSRWLLGDFLSYYFSSATMKRRFEEIRSGSTVPHLTCGVVRELMIPLPKVAEQQKIVADLRAVEERTSGLAAIATDKISSIIELKQSILQKAFSGELIAKDQSAAVSLTSNSIVNISRDTAMVLALAYERHKRRNRDKSLGHTKEQKILHMVEAEAGFDLGRHPIRDAAGPNDFEHMLAAEEWAEANQYFKLVKRTTGGYQFQPLPRFQELLKAAKQIDPLVRAKIERVIDTFIPMDTQRAEIFATIYAAWNNHVIEGNTPTDDEIIRAAREEWHPKKLKIPRSQFVEGLRELKRLNFMPTGRGRSVLPAAQGQLPL